MKFDVLPSYFSVSYISPVDFYLHFSITFSFLMHTYRRQVKVKGKKKTRHGIKLNYSSLFQKVLSYVPWSFIRFLFYFTYFFFLLFCTYYFWRFLLFFYLHDYLIFILVVCCRDAGWLVILCCFFGSCFVVDAILSWNTSSTVVPITIKNVTDKIIRIGICDLCYDYFFFHSLYLPSFGKITNYWTEKKNQQNFCLFYSYFVCDI